MALRLPRRRYASTFMPFLYPSIPSSSILAPFSACRFNSTDPTTSTKEPKILPTEPTPESSTSIDTTPDLTKSENPLALPSTALPEHPHHTFAAAPFSDLRRVSIAAGPGGNGCVSFLREKFIEAGPANGGDGGAGGSIYIQAVYGETSLHKLGRQGVIRGGAGRNGRGSALNGRRGDDVVIRVPVGTVVTEVERWDPADDEAAKGGLERWTHYPDSIEANMRDPKFTETQFPTHHHQSASELLRLTHPSRVHLDLAYPTPNPILLLPGSPGGLGNPHFVTPVMRRPKFATKGSKGARMLLRLELKVLADVGLVGLPNAGKSSFLRAVSGRKARVGEWAFTTLTPNIGTVVLEPGELAANETPQERFTIADIPGLVADAHLDKGLGHDFLRHVERARVLAFVLDLSRPDPVADLRALWGEVEAYASGQATPADEGMMAEMTGQGTSLIDQEQMVLYRPGGLNKRIVKRKLETMADKKWFVIANKADLKGTQEKYEQLRVYLKEVARKRGRREGKDGEIGIVPMSALRQQGVEKALEWMKSLLDL